ncbi:MAG: type IX secretion system outer membrane channel protein PorV [Candidatus Pedobacter colombiensis]|uniref:Type IX secretion system outer membrane channel protein PorV n=1 Tax=Candidatus Pedobacter colombiensis TaxID=3121371 RepID=A0AAJ6B4X0_9SPHI|nr:type IX secretion system outer membrane channel protein PorV [Pedobacter sp.]WEK17580.1 MAG: type IX secretion system outer membrane channel protein PorV [Pedobacter sp.]
MKPKIYLIASLMVCLVGWCQYSIAQEDNRVVTSGASFLLLSPDARSAGVAEAGTGLSADANSIYLNPAKLSFADNMGFSLSYTPWMRELTKDAKLGYLSAFRKLNEREAIGLSVKYLDLGMINFRDELGNMLQEYKANEFAIDASYARKLGETFAMALTGRFFRSDLGNGNYNNLLLQRTSAFAADISIYSEKDLQSGKYARRFSWGINLSNIGTKLKYSEQETTFLPMNLRIGAGYTFYTDPDNRLTLLADVNKLMVPTPPRYKRDENGDLTNQIEKGRDPNRSVPSALFTSLFDAPGGFKEELSEFVFSGGLEFSYYDQLFIRTGYLYEDPKKGNRQHFAAGLGFKVRPIRIDISYVFPSGDRYVLRNTMRFTLSYTPGANELSTKK